MAKQRVRFYYDPSVDSDIGEWLASIPRNKVSRAIRLAIRASFTGAQEGAALEERLRRVMREELAAVSIKADAPAPVGPGEDHETTGMLDSLVGNWKED